MTREEAIKWVKFVHDVLYEDKDEDIRKALDMAIDALSVIDIVDLTNGNTITKAEYDGEPSDLISRADAIEAVCNAQCELDVPHYPQCDQVKYCDEIKALLELPSADTVDRKEYDALQKDYNKLYEATNSLCDRILANGKLSADRPQGEWINKDVVRNEDNPIDEWQECECSVCGKWHTTPYAYYFNNYNYCPNCGARMEATK